MVSSLGPLGIHGDDPESGLPSRRFCMWRFLLLSLSHKVFWVRCDTNCIDSWHLRSSSLFILTRVQTRKKYRILCYPLRSNSGWLPIRCAYFILFHKNRLPADDSHAISCLIYYYWKSSKIWNCGLLQIICGALWAYTGRSICLLNNGTSGLSLCKKDTRGIWMV